MPIGQLVLFEMYVTFYALIGAMLLLDELGLEIHVNKEEL